MEEKRIIVTYRELTDAGELPVNLAELLTRAKMAIATAYAPYSKFRVGAAVLLENGKIITGSNQENASSPAGICAERVAFSAVSSLYPLIPVVALAVSVKGSNHIVSAPVSPCGICRQTILEYEERFHQNIEILLQGEEGKLYLINSVKDLLPLYFGFNDLGLNKPSVTY